MAINRIKVGSINYSRVESGYSVFKISDYEILAKFIIKSSYCVNFCLSVNLDYRFWGLSSRDILYLCLCETENDTYLPQIGNMDCLAVDSLCLYRTFFPAGTLLSGSVQHEQGTI